MLRIVSADEGSVLLVGKRAQLLRYAVFVSGGIVCMASAP